MPDPTDADPAVITDAELDEWEQGIDQGQGLELRTADFLDLIKALRACHQQSKAKDAALEFYAHADTVYYENDDGSRARAALDKGTDD